MKANSRNEVATEPEVSELSLAQLANVAGGSPTAAASNKSKASKDETPTESLSLNFTKVSFSN
jgi:hypothetical protein